MPPYWLQFIQAEGFVGHETTIPETEDISGVGADIAWLTEKESAYERDQLYPGLGVRKDGYVPVGGCAIGTGNPYFIREQDGVGGPLYRVYHDEVQEGGYDAKKAIAVVLTDYRLLKKYKEPIQAAQPIPQKHEEDWPHLRRHGHR